MDLAMLAPELAKALGVSPSTAVLLILVINRAAAAAARAIPNDATGWRGFARRVLAILGTEVQSKLTKGVTVADAAKAALLTPPITQKVENATGTAISSEMGAKPPKSNDLIGN